MFKAQIIGNIGADAQMKNINGVEYCTFDVAHSVKNGDSEKTVWISCLARGFNNVIPYLKRGTKVYVCGDLSCRLYDSSHYHCKMIGFSVFVDTLQLCSPKQDESSPKSEATENFEDNQAPF